MKIKKLPFVWLVVLSTSVFLGLNGCKTAEKSQYTEGGVKKQENAIACIYMRGGTSKGPFFDMRDLPSNIEERNKILLKVMGSPDPLQIDGLGGTETVTSKVVMAMPSKRKGIDVDYLFAQVDINKPIVDTTPPCGNMMAGVGPFAIEKGWVKATIPETRVMVYNINTNSTIEEIVQTPNGKVVYEGKTQIDGVPGTAAPVVMNLQNLVGGKTGKLFPTQNLKDTIQGIAVSVLDAGMLMVLMKAEDLGMTGSEDAGFFIRNKELMQKIEKIRLEVGQKIGMGDVSNSVLPKVGILSKPQEKGHNIQSRYLTPHTLHPAHAVTGAICVSTALKIKGTVAADVGIENGGLRELVYIEHPSGVIEINVEMEKLPNNTLTLKTAGSLRTVRKIMAGFVFH